MSYIIESISKHGVKTSQADRFRYQKPRPGDVVDFGETYQENPYPFNHARYGRIDTVGASSWCSNPDDVMICCHLGSAFLLEDGKVSISGGPFHVCKLADLDPQFELSVQHFWNWGNNLPGADQGVDYYIARPVFKLTNMEGAK